jgi:hypothetical protein
LLTKDLVILVHILKEVVGLKALFDLQIKFSRGI